MQLPTISRPTFSWLPPIYNWPDSIKRTLLIFAVLTVLTAYIVLAGAVVAILAILVGIIGG